MNEIEINEAGLKPLVAVLKKLKSRYYELPRYESLNGEFEREMDQFLSAHLAEQHVEGRGLMVTGGTRTGKSHDIKHLLRVFTASTEPLDGNFQRKYLRVSLRSAVNWRGLGMAVLEPMEFPFSLDHRRTDTI